MVEAIKQILMVIGAITVISGCAAAFFGILFRMQDRG